MMTYIAVNKAPVYTHEMTKPRIMLWKVKTRPPWNGISTKGNEQSNIGKTYTTIEMLNIIWYLYSGDVDGKSIIYI